MNRNQPLAVGFGVMGGLCEIQLPPAGRLTPGPGDSTAFVTYVHRGAIELEDVSHNPDIAYAGEFLLSATPPALLERKTRASRTAGASLFRIAVRLAENGPVRAGERTRFTTAQRSHRLCVVASPDGRDGSLQLDHDVVVYSSILDPGHHLAHERSPGRVIWVHVIRGVASLDEVVLKRGDSARVSIEPRVSLTAQESTEVLVIDLGSALAGRERADS